MKKPTLTDVAARPTRPTAPAPHVVAAHAAVHGTTLSRMSLDIPTELHRAVKARAAAEGKPLREAVMELLASYVAR